MSLPFYFRKEILYYLAIQRNLAGMAQLHHLNCVEIQPPAGGRAIGHCMLLESRNKLVLVDTGISLLDTRWPQERVGKEFIDAVGFLFNEERTAISQIKKMRLDPESVSDCVISHLDYDHISGVADFPNATLHVGVEEYNAYNNDSGNLRYQKTPLLHNPKIVTYAETNTKLFGIEARRVEIDIDADIFLIPLFGHTVGHCGVAINIGNKWILYVGDAYYLRLELYDPIHPVNELAKIRAENNELRLATLNTIRKFMSEHPEVVVFGFHDPKEFEPFE